LRQVCWSWGPKSAMACLYNRCAQNSARGMVILGIARTSSRALVAGVDKCASLFAGILLKRASLSLLRFRNIGVAPRMAVAAQEEIACGLVVIFRGKWSAELVTQEVVAHKEGIDAAHLAAYQRVT